MAEAPGKLAYAYYLQETTDDDTPTSRSYVALSVKKNEPGRLTLTLRRRAVNAAGQAADESATTSLASSGTGIRIAPLS